MTVLKNKRGRPPIAVHRVRKDITLPPDLLPIAQSLGQGNISAGIELALRHYIRYVNRKVNGES